MAEDEVPGVDEEIDAEIDIAVLEGLRPQEQVAALGADIEDDLAKSGPLSAYLLEVRAKAVTAYRQFATLDLDDKAAIRDCQDAVRHFLDVMEFMRRALKAAEQAAAEIDERLNEGDQPRDD